MKQQTSATWGIPPRYSISKLLQTLGSMEWAKQTVPLHLVISIHPKHVLVVGNQWESYQIINHPNSLCLENTRPLKLKPPLQALVAIDFQAQTEVQLPAITGIHPSKVLAIGLFGRPSKNLKNRNEIQWNIWENSIVGLLSFDKSIMCILLLYITPGVDAVNT